MVAHHSMEGSHLLLDGQTWSLLYFLQVVITRSNHFTSNLMTWELCPVGSQQALHRSGCDPSSSQSAKQFLQRPEMFLHTFIVDYYIVDVTIDIPSKTFSNPRIRVAPGFTIPLGTRRNSYPVRGRFYPPAHFYPGVKVA